MEVSLTEVMKMREKMCERLFRGKLTEIFADAVKMRPDLAAKGIIKDGFVYGSLVIGCDAYGCDGYFICVSAYMWDESYVNNSDATMFEVDPETAGQYIGKTDKNGKKIFEGDIVKGKVHLIGGYRIRSLQVDYDSTAARFALKDEYDFKNIPEVCEVVGNIYDNPELL